MYDNQDLDFVLKMKEKYSKLDNVKMTMNKALSLLDSFVDPSDTDVDEPNSVHAYQTAERIRRKYPVDKEYQIIGLIHDLGKVLFTFIAELRFLLYSCNFKPDLFVSFSSFDSPSA